MASGSGLAALSLEFSAAEPHNTIGLQCTHIIGHRRRSHVLRYLEPLTCKTYVCVTAARTREIQRSNNRLGRRLIYCCALVPTA